MADRRAFSSDGARCGVSGISPSRSEGKSWLCHGLGLLDGGSLGGFGFCLLRAQCQPLVAQHGIPQGPAPSGIGEAGITAAVTVPACKDDGRIRTPAGGDDQPVILGRGWPARSIRGCQGRAGARSSTSVRASCCSFHFLVYLYLTWRLVMPDSLAAGPGSCLCPGVRRTRVVCSSGLPVSKRISLPWPGRRRGALGGSWRGVVPRSKDCCRPRCGRLAAS